MPSIFHVLFIQVDGGWYAQCLEVDIGAQGMSRDAAEHSFFETWRMQAQIDRESGRQPFEGLGPAPERYQAMLKDVPIFERAVPSSASAEPADAIPPPFMYAASVPRRCDSVPSSKG